METLRGKTAIITGANRGIGHQIVKTFAEEGCDIWACARKKDEEFEQKISELAADCNVRITPLYFDITDTAEMKVAVSVVQKSKIPIDILVNCAGIFQLGPFQMTKADDIRRVFDTNYFAPVELTRYVTKLMMRQKKGSVVNIASIAGLDPHPANTAYGSSKAAMIMFTQILATELAEFGIRVNAVAPGNTDTEMIRSLIESAGEHAMHAITAMGRFARPQEIAEVVAFLASDKASFVNGEVIRVDGGRK